MQSLFSALVLDDESKALELMKKLLEDTLQFGDVRTAQSAGAAWKELHNFTPDLIFLDIKMPGQNGMSFLRQLQHQNIRSGIVFVTAYDEFVLDALRRHAFGYLLKPVNRRELHDCIEDFKNHRARYDSSQKLDQLFERLEEKARIRIDTRSGYYFVDISSILFCEADGNYTRINLGEESHLCTLQLGMVESVLPARSFVRVGRSLLVNCSAIVRVDRKSQVISFENDSKVFSLKVSRSQLKELEKGMRHESIAK